MEEGSRNSYVKIEPNAGCMAQQSSVERKEAATYFNRHGEEVD
jgi:hypothetical protein